MYAGVYICTNQQHELHKTIKNICNKQQQEEGKKTAS